MPSAIVAKTSARMPMMPIRDVVIFPHMMSPFVVGRAASVKALEASLAHDKKIFLATQHDASSPASRRPSSSTSSRARA